MTNIQLGYQNLQEARQHNRATEEQARNELQLGRDQLGELNRHNITTEYLDTQRVNSQVALNSAQAILARANADKVKLEKDFTAAKKKIYDKYAEHNAEYEQGILYHQRESAAYNAQMQQVNRDVSRATKTVQIVQQYAGIIGSALGGVKTFGEAANTYGQVGKTLYE